MKKLNETYVHEETGITFDVQYETKEMYPVGLDVEKRTTKKIQIQPSGQSGWVRGDKGFVFNRSKAETIKKIGKALLEIGEFCEKL
jgi:hypothetical protein